MTSTSNDNIAGNGRALVYLYSCYELIQRFRVTGIFTGQYNTALLWHITDFFILYSEWLDQDVGC